MRVWALQVGLWRLSYREKDAASAASAMEMTMTTLPQTRSGLRDWLLTLGAAFVSARKQRNLWGSF